MMATRNGKIFSAKDICKRLGIPEFYTRKGLQVLSRLGILKSIKGPGGGYELAGSAGKLSVLRIIHAVDGKNTFSHCVMGLPRCNEKNPCAIHEIWAHSKKKLLNDLNAILLCDLVDAGVRQKIYGLTKQF